MSDNTSPYQARYLLNPFYWPLWLGMGVLYLTTLLPYRVILMLAYGLGWLGFYLLPQRRRTMRTNIRLTNPDLTETQTRQLLRKTFYSSTLMLFEVAWAWWAGDKKLQSLVRYEGLEILRDAQAQGKGVILLGCHSTNLEILGRFMAYQANNIYPTYKQAHNKLFDLIMTRNRRGMNKGIVASSDMRGILKLLKQQQTIWYAPDQDFGIERSVFAPGWPEFPAPRSCRFFASVCPVRKAMSCVLRQPCRPFPPGMMCRMPPRSMLHWSNMCAVCRTSTCGGIAVLKHARQGRNSSTHSNVNTCAAIA